MMLNFLRIDLEECTYKTSGILAITLSHSDHYSNNMSAKNTLFFFHWLLTVALLNDCLGMPMIEINAALLEITATRNKWQEILKEVSIFIVEHQIQEEK